ncbi:MAG: hypothetical protein EOL86_04150 [Deltaproteobacteria bacterium]|nr:hypothetical protein [Deltaproteobacteria bacterium]
MDARVGSDSKVDVLTREHAVEVEKARNWDNKAIDKSLENANRSGKKAGIAIIREGSSLDDYRVRRLKREIRTRDLDIKVWEIENKDEEQELHDRKTTKTNEAEP